MTGSEDSRSASPTAQYFKFPGRAGRGRPVGRAGPGRAGPNRARLALRRVCRARECVCVRRMLCAFASVSPLPLPTLSLCHCLVVFFFQALSVRLRTSRRPSHTCADDRTRMRAVSAHVPCARARSLPLLPWRVRARFARSGSALRARLCRVRIACAEHVGVQSRFGAPPQLPIPTRRLRRQNAAPTRSRHFRGG